VPHEEEVAREFPHGSSAPLREQRPLIDAEGDDIRQYTGEPVETEYGTVLPQQMVVGSQRVVGGGEFPNTPGRFEPEPEEPQMTDQQDNYLHALAAQAGEQPPAPDLSAEEAAAQIRRLQKITGRDDE